MTLSEDDFWQASLHLYAQPGMQAHLLELQDQQGLNVNLELLRIVLSEARPHSAQMEPLSETEYQHLHTAVMRFSRAYTHKVRTLRRELTCPQPGATNVLHNPHLLNEKSRKQLKSQLLAAELSLEKEEQALLLQSLRDLRR